MEDWDRFEELYQVYRLPVFRYLCRRLPRDQAEDAMSEVFVAAWAGTHRLRGDPLPWLYGIARHTVSRFLRNTAGAERADEAARGGGHEPSHRAAEHEVVDRMDALRALHELDPRDREALLLIAWEGLGVREAARAAGCSAGAFTVRLHRARRRLEKSMDERSGAVNAARQEGIRR
ncbi:RNA polymerase sigma factor [Streptomyces sp. AN091965]|uniref:RNA polymerase sigma factor n=1 Tax=Streptomyces sp. AN091965 TaxID=2927803 RepID=UPI001F607766|nr:sigma-70 family RNA polymerase sigma factor [Streptomyces sp. AN091965]MCI3927828.1 sigma-70 family RNA polymerase sigma factor [Streptomyces sp. AN091965]